MLDLNFHPFPTISTERLVLREITEADGNEIFHLRSDKDVMQYLDRPLAETIEDALKLIKVISDGHTNQQSITWAITLQNDPLLIGTIGFWRIEKEHYRAEIGYLLNPTQQGKGIMQEAVKAVLQYGFENMKLHSVEANVNPGNATSIKLLEKNGFVREGYFKENYYYNGQFLDSAIYSLLAG